MNKVKYKVLVFTGIIMTLPVLADSDAVKVGANAGAMSYCKDKVVSRNDRAKYNVQLVKALEEFDALDKKERRRAVVSKNAADKGDYLGNPLTKQRCESVRNTLIVRYNNN